MEKILDLVVIFKLQVEDSLQQSFRVGIDHENRSFESVKQYRVGGFFSDTFDIQEFLSQSFSILSFKGFWVKFVVLKPV
ncbi:hypothetical protein A4H02_09015 [Fervidobacterium thailandense]|uniref:Uncharacterized protein n=1 Tax=Fervidobacterium thailandense TaxID=1008305 RepID=A0A1E3G0H3_9BACT|nr:hypothetical protein A4H02_09015 [Fervidobacterium thailandense]